ncbi:MULTISPECIES: type II toxin-antitoxin system VapC family toxin [unclassified Bradyrhizobium]|uniref:type II toxin-antitoxin system VapC family toxin n=1 Tax=unclassified Bradyrhizobium TaxID=2631580 RepID=UPI0028EDC707|nr:MULTISPECIES: PIN domain-containing protein [unclassified Bradyrhizobium]
MVVIDSTNLLLMLRPDTRVPRGADGKPIDRAKERIDYLVARLNKAKSKIIIPTPALGEALVRAGAAASQQIVDELQKYAVFSIEPFDTRAALEVAAMSRTALANGNKKANSTAPWQKVKFDRQIVAIAKVHGATEIYSDDSDIAALGAHAKIKVIRLADLPLPPEKDQLVLQLEPATAGVEAISGDEG